LHAQAYALLFLCSIHVTFIVLYCIVLALAIHSAYCIKRFSLLTAMMSNKLLLTTHCQQIGLYITASRPCYTVCDFTLHWSHSEWRGWL